MKTRASGCGLIVAAALALASPTAAMAGDPPKGGPSDPSPEARRQMAAVHKKMAACLESERPIAECRTEMAKTCRTMMGETGCPMMDSMGGGMGPGMMGGHGPHGGVAPKKGSEE